MSIALLLLSLGSGCRRVLWSLPNLCVRACVRVRVCVCVCARARVCVGAGGAFVCVRAFAC